MRDALTGTYNRRFMNERLPVDLVAMALSEKSISVIIADIDHFKYVNDTYGHLTGDSILKYFSGTLLSCIRRDSDWVARFGGEEFLICLPGASLEKAHELAEQMRSAVEQAEYLCGEHTIKITASFGICSVKPRQGDSTDAIIDAADKKLYHAKNNGRNRVEY
jgi:diguanylate cyclase (GGDEF)-like protein